ncbi:MAG TPA: phage capsid protein [Sphingomicrobium sp.]|nr:phage capsid protein [Sphingomicrobium sp.]
MGDVTFTAQTRFENNMRLELQQKTAKLGPSAIQRDVAGAEKTKLDNLIANHVMRKKTERNGDVVHDTTGWDGVWVAAPDPDYLATLVDNEDKLLTRVDIQGGEIMAHSAAYNRSRDAAWLTGFFGDMITGKQGTVLNAFPAGNVVPVTHDGAGGATPIGMRVAKLRRMRRIFAENFVDLDAVELYVGLTAAQVEELSEDAKAINKDYADAVKPVWSADGKKILSIAGFGIVELELGNPLFGDAADLTVDGNGYRKNPCWTSDGMVEAVWENLFTSVDKLPTKHFSAQVYTRHQRVFSRTDQNRCGYILNLES